MIFSIPDNELRFDFVRSSGPGGQKVNKTSSKVQLRWTVGQSAIFSAEQKELIRACLRNQLNKNDEIIISSDEERSQFQNKAKTMERLNSLVNKILKPRKKRLPTKPTRASKIKRLESKIKLSLKKKNRRKGVHPTQYTSRFA